MLDVRRLRVLCEVARHGSFSAAADVLGYTQPAVSRQIATLEAEVGTTLVRRVPQGAVLTDAGRVLVARAGAVLAQLAAAGDRPLPRASPGRRAERRDERPGRLAAAAALRRARSRPVSRRRLGRARA